MKIEIEGFNFEGYIAKIIVDEFQKLRKEFEPYFWNSPCDVELKFCTEELLLWNVIKNIKGHLSREKIREILIDFENIRYGQYCYASFELKSVNSAMGSVMKLEKMSIEMHTDRLNDLIINHLDNLELVIENIKFSIRHEFGHILEYITYHGMSEDEFIAMENRRNKELDEWYTSVDGKKRTMDDIRRYYGLESEGIANMLADVDVEAKLKNEEMMGKLDHTKLKTTLTITSEYEPLKEYSAELTITSTHEPIEEEG